VASATSAVSRRRRQRRPGDPHGGGGAGPDRPTGNTAPAPWVVRGNSTGQEENPDRARVARPISAFSSFLLIFDIFVPWD
jgi:hypothetical protein